MGRAVGARRSGPIGYCHATSGGRGGDEVRRLPVFPRPADGDVAADDNAEADDGEDVVEEDEAENDVAVDDERE